MVRWRSWGAVVPAGHWFFLVLGILPKSRGRFVHGVLLLTVLGGDFGVILTFVNWSMCFVSCFVFFC